MKEGISFANATADLAAEFIRIADGDEGMIKQLSSRIDCALTTPKARKQAVNILDSIKDEILTSDKEGQKRGNNASNRDGPASAGGGGSGGLSAFGAKAGSKTFVVDEMLASGRYKMLEIVDESKASLETVKRRMRELKKRGHEVQENLDGKVGVAKEATHGHSDKKGARKG